jgi:hypothetical protein
VGDHPLGGKAGGQSATAYRVGHGEEQAAALDQPPLEKGVAHPGQAARDEHPRARPAYLMAVEGDDERYRELLRER